MLSVSSRKSTGILTFFFCCCLFDGLHVAVLDKEGDTSILKTKEASYVNGKLVLNSYLDKYPFPLYILLSHVEALPETLADALRQWFELLQRQTST